MALPIVPLVTLNRAELRDKIYGCWVGKNIGGTLGGPYETRRDILDIQGYLTAPGEPLANDDLDLQLVWLKAVQERGPLGVTAAVLGEYWLNYVSAPWSEYGTSKANQRAGLAPPLSGMYNNPWKDSNGAWIRSEIWACLAPGCPGRGDPPGLRGRRGGPRRGGGDVRGALYRGRGERGVRGERPGYADAHRPEQDPGGVPGGAGHPRGAGGPRPGQDLAGGARGGGGR